MSVRPSHHLLSTWLKILKYKKAYNENSHLHLISQKHSSLPPETISLPVSIYSLLGLWSCWVFCFVFVFTKIEVKFLYSHPKVYNSVACSVFTMLYNHHLSLDSKFFINPEKNDKNQNPPLSNNHAPLSPPPISWAPLICFPSLWIGLFWIYHLKGVI